MTTPDLAFAMRLLFQAQLQVKNLRHASQAGIAGQDEDLAKWEALRDEAIDNALAAWGEATHETL